ncbi:MAG: hypothetical protein IPK65_07140 [Gammaproteobacteria bacterium]|nr:hypothetical protein [Gammaproteobacteria bacterium]
MLMHKTLKDGETSDGVDQKKAETIARRVARSARNRAVVAWSQGKYRDLFQSEQVFLDFAYDYTYKMALRKTLARQKARSSGYRLFSV